PLFRTSMLSVSSRAPSRNCPGAGRRSLTSSPLSTQSDPVPRLVQEVESLPDNPIRGSAASPKQVALPTLWDPSIRIFPDWPWPPVIYSNANSTYPSGNSQTGLRAPSATLSPGDFARREVCYHADPSERAALPSPLAARESGPKELRVGLSRCLVLYR